MVPTFLVCCFFLLCIGVTIHIFYNDHDLDHPLLQYSTKSVRPFTCCSHQVVAADAELILNNDGAIANDATDKTIINIFDLVSITMAT